MVPKKSIHWERDQLVSEMRLCLIVPSYFPATIYGGPIVSVHRTCEKLAAQGVNVSVSTANANGNTRLDVEPNIFLQLAEKYRVKYYDDTIIGRFSLRFTAFVWKDIRDCDLVRVEDIFSTYIPPSLFYAHLFRKPVLISPRGVLSQWALRSKRSWLKRWWLATLIRPLLGSAWWHATSEEERADIARQFPNARIVVIPNGIEPSDYADAPRRSRAEYFRHFTGADRGIGPVIVSMGRLHAVKGFDILIDAFAELGEPFKHAVLLIAGSDDGQKVSLSQRVVRLGLQGRVFFVGERLDADKVAFLTGADLFVLPSHSENFGNAYLEAMACGVPVVASRASPWGEVEEFGCGKWVENSVAATSAAMRAMLLTDRSVVGARARMLAARYSWDGVATQFLAAFHDILRGRSAVGSKA